MAKMMKAAQEMKERMENLQEEMHRMMVTGESGNTASGGEIVMTSRSGTRRRSESFPSLSACSATFQQSLKFPRSHSAIASLRRSIRTTSRHSWKGWPRLSAIA